MSDGYRAKLKQQLTGTGTNANKGNSFVLVLFRIIKTEKSTLILTVALAPLLTIDQILNGPFSLLQLVTVPVYRCSRLTRAKLITLRAKMYVSKEDK